MLAERPPSKLGASQRTGVSHPRPALEEAPLLGNFENLREGATPTCLVAHGQPPNRLSPHRPNVPKCWPPEWESESLSDGLERCRSSLEESEDMSPHSCRLPAVPRRRSCSSRRR